VRRHRSGQALVEYVVLLALAPTLTHADRD
jgi:hypothetical protein